MAGQISTSRTDFALAQIEAAKRLPETWLSADAVRLLTGWSRPTLYRKAAEGNFPKPVARGRWHGGAVLSTLAGGAVKAT